MENLRFRLSSSSSDSAELLVSCLAHSFLLVDTRTRGEDVCDVRFTFLAKQYSRGGWVRHSRLSFPRAIQDGAGVCILKGLG